MLASTVWALTIYALFWGGPCTAGDEPDEASCAGLAEHWGPVLHELYWDSVVLAPLSFILGCALLLVGAIGWLVKNVHT